LYPVTWLPVATLSSGPAVSIVSVASALAFCALPRRSHCNTYWFILANLNSVAGDEVRFSGCVNHQEESIEAPEDQTRYLGDTCNVEGPLLPFESRQQPLPLDLPKIARSAPKSLKMPWDCVPEGHKQEKARGQDESCPPHGAPDVSLLEEDEEVSGPIKPPAVTGSSHRVLLCLLILLHSSSFSLHLCGGPCPSSSEVPAAAQAGLRFSLGPYLGGCCHCAAARPRGSPVACGGRSR